LSACSASHKAPRSAFGYSADVAEDGDDNGNGGQAPHLGYVSDVLDAYLLCMPIAAADDDALPWPGMQGSGDDGRHVVAPVQADQARLDTEAVLSEPGYAHLDRVGYWLGVNHRDPVNT
jgi:hypothetical protein